jgi:transposase-like protein
MRERNGNVIAKVVDDTKQKTIEPIVINNIAKGSTVHTDEWHAYRNLGLRYDHSRVYHGAKEYVNGMAHTNGIENFWSHLKRGIDGIYHWVSFKHLQTYVNEFTLRFNSRNMGTSERFDFVLGNISGRLSYKVLINGK